MPTDPSVRERLLELVGRIPDPHDYREPDHEFLAAFEKLLPGTDIDNLRRSDYPDETVVDICLGEADTHRQLSREELLALVKIILSAPEGTEAESVLRVLAFSNNCKHPAGSDLIFYPEESFGGRSEPTPEEIVDKAMRGE